MKISQKQKQDNRRKIIRAAVDLMIDKGFKAATMRQIARCSEVGDATIYNYFPTKEAILFAYYEDHFQLCAASLKAIDNFNTFTFQEQIQTYFETSLELYLPDREFVALSYKTVFFSLSQNYQLFEPIRRQFILAVGDMFEAAMEVDELPPLVFSELVVQLFWDYYIAVLAYWLNDTSPRFGDTSILIDKSLDLSMTLLKSGVVNKMFDLAVMLFKTHILSKLPNLKNHVDMAHAVKREFMGGIHADRDSGK
ncbi:MAG: TetR family transcriptional regulator [Desulfobacteraceae bacterium]|nr:TetR family transcriptional regulator [Desulfobacteraceae bacterium]